MLYALTSFLIISKESDTTESELLDNIICKEALAKANPTLLKSLIIFWLGFFDFKKLEIIDIDKKENLLVIKGSIPGKTGNLVSMNLNH